MGLLLLPEQHAGFDAQRDAARTTEGVAEVL